VLLCVCVCFPSYHECVCVCLLIFCFWCVCVCVCVCVSIRPRYPSRWWCQVDLLGVLCPSCSSHPLLPQRDSVFLSFSLFLFLFLPFPVSSFLSFHPSLLSLLLLLSAS